MWVVHQWFKLQMSVMHEVLGRELAKHVKPLQEFSRTEHANITNYQQVCQQVEDGKWTTWGENKCNCKISERKVFGNITYCTRFSGVFDLVLIGGVPSEKGWRGGGMGVYTVLFCEPKHPTPFHLCRVVFVRLDKTGYSDNVCFFVHSSRTSFVKVQQIVKEERVWDKSLYR